ncbi:MAG: hypothetical protein ABRQ26_14675 [Syntrophomonadaceae bacterium]
MDNDLIQITENFGRQRDLYSIMLDLAGKQWNLLNEQGQNPSSNEVHQVLVQRQELLEVIVKLNQENKDLQSRAVEELGLERFVLSEVRKHMDATSFSRLQSRLAELGRLLDSINNMDKQNQRLMEKKTLNSPGQSLEKATSEKARQAYRNAMKQKDKNV